MLHPSREDFKDLYFQEGYNFIATLFPGKEQQQDADAACAYIVQSLKSNQFRVCRLCFNDAVSNDPPARVRWSHSAETQSDGATLIVPPTSTVPLQEIIDKSTRVQMLEARLDTPCQHPEPVICEKTAFELDVSGGVGVLYLNFLTEHDAESGKKVKLEEGKVSLVHPFTVSLQKINGAYFEVRVIGVLYRSSSRGHDNGHYITVVLFPDNSSRLLGNGLRIRDFSPKETAAILKQGFLPTKCETSLTADPTRLRPKDNKFLVRAIFTNSGPIQVDQTILDILEEPIPDEPEPESKSEPQIESDPVEALPNSLAPDSLECRRRGHSKKRKCNGGCLIFPLYCLVCMDNKKDGSFCCNLHFVCSDCYKNHIRAEKNALNNFQIRCVGFNNGCTYVVDEDTAKTKNIIYYDGRLGSPETFKMFTIVESESEPEELISEDLFVIFSQKVQPKCPRCKQVWSTPEDGDCAAVTCGKIGCGINFCGYCSGAEHNTTEVSREQAHNHVKHCPFNFRQGVYHPPVSTDGKTDFGIFEAVHFQSTILELCAWLKTLQSEVAVDLVVKYGDTPTANRGRAHYCLDSTLNMLKVIQIDEAYSRREEWTTALLKCREDFMQQVLSRQAAIYDNANQQRVCDEHVIVFYLSYLGTSSSTCSKSSPRWSSSTSSGN